MDLIIARYKENINWLDKIKENANIDNIYLYNKFFDDDGAISLPNVGREAHTYLYHIVNNYDKLNEFNIFLQGDPFPHSPNLSHLINNIDNNKDIQPLNHITIENESHYNRKHELHPHGLFLAYFMDLLFDLKLDINQTVAVSYGAQFICSKKAIQNRPIEFYEFLLKFVSYQNTSIECYIFERLWLYIFDTNIPLSNKYKMWT